MDVGGRAMQEQLPRTPVSRTTQDTYMDVSGRTTHMYRKYGIRVTQDAVTEEIKSSSCRGTEALRKAH